MPDLEPRIGLFWGIPRGTPNLHLVGLSRPISAVPALGGFKTLDEGHVEVWPRLTKRLPDLRGLPYEHFPRGRVNWRNEDDMFLLLLDRKLMTGDFVSTVVSRWHLPKERLLILSDPHYRSPSR